MDDRVTLLVEAAEAMERGNFDAVPEVEGADAVSRLARSLRRLGETFEHRLQQTATLARVTETINTGLLVDEVLNHVYESFRPLIPYDRIGFASLDGPVVRAQWARGEAAELQIFKGYALPLGETSLAAVAASETPRIINDLQEYARRRPASKSARRMLQEGIRSNLTCPLRARGRVLGFLFFSSREVGAYREPHVAVMLQLAAQIAMIVEKSRLYEDLSAAINLRDRWVGMAAHDLRNPLSSIQGYLKLMQEGAMGGLTERQETVVARMLRASDSMLSMINDLLAVSAVDAGSLELDRRPVAAATFLANCRDAIDLQAASKAIAVELEVPAEPLVLDCDFERLSQAVVNLLTNAIKFSPRGSRVTLRACSQPPYVRIDVVDQGVGIAPEELSRLFHPFGRTSSRPTEGESSTGLGLAIVKKLVELHGGQVSVQSAPGQGSTFTLLVPARSPTA